MSIKSKTFANWTIIEHSMNMKIKPISTPIKRLIYMQIYGNSGFPRGKTKAELTSVVHNFSRKKSEKNKIRIRIFKNFVRVLKPKEKLNTLLYYFESLL